MASLKARLRLTEKCLNRCWYCYVPKNNEEMSFDTAILIRDKLKDIYDKGNYPRIKITLTGGDPTLHPNFLEISKLFFDVFPNLVIATEVCTTANFDVVKKFVELGGRFVASLNEDKIEDIVEMVKFGKQKQKLNHLNILFTPFNIDRLDEILQKTVIENNFKIRFNHLYDFNDSVEFKDMILPAVEKVGKFLVEHKYKYYDYLFGLINFYKPRNSYCGYGKNFYYFDTEGNVYRCNEGPSVSHITDSDMEDRMKCSSEVSDKCRRCEDYRYCMGGCYFANQGQGKYCKEYTAMLKYMKQLKNIRTLNGWKSHLDVAKWLEQNFVYDVERLKFSKIQGILKNYQPPKLPEETIRSKSGTCIDSVELTKEALNIIDPSYKAEVVWLRCRPEYDYDHCVCKFEQNGEIFMMDYGNHISNKHMNGIHGPYKSLDEYKEYYEKNNATGKKVKNIYYGWPLYRQRYFKNLEETKYK